MRGSGGEPDSSPDPIRLTAATTSSTLIAFKHAPPCTHRCRLHGEQSTDADNTVWPAPYGPILRGSVGPKIATTGVPTAAARCIGPESLVTNTVARRRSTASC